MENNKPEKIGVTRREKRKQERDRKNSTQTVVKDANMLNMADPGSTTAARAEGAQSSGPPTKELPTIIGLDVSAVLQEEIGTEGLETIRVLEEKLTIHSDKIISSITSMKTEVIAYVEDKLSDMKKELEEMRGKISVLCTSDATLTRKCEELREENRKLQEEIHSIKHREEKQFEPEVSLVLYGIPETENEDVEETVETILLAVAEDPDGMVRAERIQSRNGRPGVIKLEMIDVESKVKLLRKKNEIREQVGL